jgi:hypothetical protein
VAAQLAHAFRSPLAHLDIVIHEDVSGAHGLLEGHVGGRCCGFWVRWDQGAARVWLQGLVSVRLLWLLVSGIPGVRQVIGNTSLCFKAVFSFGRLVGSDGVIC